MSDEVKERLTLVNKIVKARDSSNGIDNSGVIRLMYPDFIVKDEIFFDYENSVIIESKYSPTLRSDLEHGTKNFIAICDSGMFDVDFTDKETILQLLKDKYGSFSKDKISAMMEMGEKEFWREFKKQWVVKLQRDKNDEEIGSLIMKFYKSLGGRSDEIFNVYFKLREYFSDGNIFSMTLNFIDRSLHPEKVSSKSGNYLKIMRMFQERYGRVAQVAVEECNKLVADNSIDKMYRTMFLLKCLGKGSSI